MSDKESLLKSLTDLIDKHFGSTKKTTIIKQLDQELKEATFVVLVPDQVDAHGDIYDADVVKDACEDFEKSEQRTNLEHMFMVGEGVVEIKESFITDDDTFVGDTFIKKGSWLQTWKFNNEDIWKSVKDGHFNGLSVQCQGITEAINE